MILAMMMVGSDRTSGRQMRINQFFISTGIHWFPMLKNVTPERPLSRSDILACFASCNTRPAQLLVVN